MASYFAAGTTTPITPVVAPPTTAAQFVLWNGEGTGGKNYYVTSIGSSTIVTAGAALIIQAWAHLGSAVLMPSVTVAKGPSRAGRAEALTHAQIGTAGTIVNNSVWHPVGESVNAGAATATVALGTWANVNGIYVIPPGGLLSLAVVCSAAGGSVTCNLYVTWYEE